MSRRILTILAVLTGALLCPTTAVADEPAPQDLVSFGVSPAGPELPDQRPYLAYSVAPGMVVHDFVAVLNQDDQPIGLDVYGGDVIMAEGGGLTVRIDQEADTDAGAWVTVERARVDVAPQTPETGVGYQIVPFSISVPADARPGDHVGAVVASLRTLGDGGANAPAIELDQRVAARVYVRVAGDAQPGLVVKDVRTSWRPDGGVGGVLGRGIVTVRYSLRNAGNVTLGVEPAVSVSGPLGLLPRNLDDQRLDDLLPGGSVEREVVVDNVWASIWNGAEVSAVAVAPTIGEDPGIGTVRAASGVWAMPWLALGLLLAVAAVGALVWYRRYRRSHPRPDGGRPSDTGAPLAVHAASAT